MSLFQLRNNKLCSLPRKASMSRMILFHREINNSCGSQEVNLRASAEDSSKLSQSTFLQSRTLSMILNFF